MSHADPSRESANVVESALDLLLEKLERRRLGKLKRAPRKPSSRAGKQNTALEKVRLALKKLGFRDAEAGRAVAEPQCSTRLDGAGPGFGRLLRRVPLGESCQR